MRQVASRAYHCLAVSEGAVGRVARSLIRLTRAFYLPVPMFVVRPLVELFLLFRTCYYWLFRVFICEPFLKAQCSHFGVGVHTGVFLHWIEGRGDIRLGNRVTMDGKSAVSFAARFSTHPLLSIGDNTFVSHDVTFVIGSRVEIGNGCYIASGVRISDSNGHPIDPAKRLAGEPPAIEDVKPVFVGDNVWIGARATVLPGVCIGEGSVIAAAAVVTRNVAANTLVGGVPARLLKVLTPVGATSYTEGHCTRSQHDGF